MAGRGRAGGSWEGFRGVAVVFGMPICETGVERFPIISCTAAAHEGAGVCEWGSGSGRND